MILTNCCVFSPQVLVHQPQILKTDSLVMTLKPDGTQVLSTMQNPTGITTLTTPIQTTALQMPVRLLFTRYFRGLFVSLLSTNGNEWEREMGTQTWVPSVAMQAHVCAFILGSTS